MKLHALLTLSLFSISSSLFGSAAQVKSDAERLTTTLKDQKQKDFQMVEMEIGSSPQPTSEESHISAKTTATATAAMPFHMQPDSKPAFSQQVGCAPSQAAPDFVPVAATATAALSFYMKPGKKAGFAQRINATRDFVPAAATATAAAPATSTQSQPILMPKEIHEFLVNACADVNSLVDPTGYKSLKEYLTANPHNINAIVEETGETIAMLAVRSWCPAVSDFGCSEDYPTDYMRKDKKGWTVVEHFALRFNLDDELLKKITKTSQ